MGSGWPEWVAGPERAEEFDREINQLQSQEINMILKLIIFYNPNSWFILIKVLYTWLKRLWISYLERSTIF